MLAKAEVATLATLTPEQKARAWCAMNSYERPTELAAHWPANWETMTREAKHDFLGPLMFAILDAIGLRACLREWNRDRMTDAEFDTWWQSKPRLGA